MDVVYLVKHSEDNEELRYSLRSLANVPHDKVHFVGYKPTWTKDVVEHAYDPGVPPLREKHGKWWKSWRMMRFLCTLDEISEDFILFNDDFFVMKPVDEIPALHRGPIDGVVGKYRKARPTKVNPYVSTMIETQEILKSLGKTTLCYEIHTPIVMNRHQMIDSILMVEAMSRPGQMHINKRSFYGNYWEIGGEEVKDVKIDSGNPQFDPDSTFLSTSDHSFIRRTVGQHIKKAFPQEGSYEIKGSQRARANYHRTPRTGRWAGVVSRGTK